MSVPTAATSLSCSTPGRQPAGSRWRQSTAVTSVASGTSRPAEHRGERRRAARRAAAGHRQAARRARAAATSSAPVEHAAGGGQRRRGRVDRPRRRRTGRRARAPRGRSPASCRPAARRPGAGRPSGPRPSATTSPTAGRRRAAPLVRRHAHVDARRPGRARRAARAPSTTCSQTAACQCAGRSSATVAPGSTAEVVAQQVGGLGHPVGERGRPTARCARRWRRRRT